MQLARVSTLDFRARVRIGRVQGLFRVRPLSDSRIFPEVGLYRPEEELTEYGSNQALLKSIAQTTGGRLIPCRTRPSTAVDSRLNRPRGCGRFC